MKNKELRESFYNRACAACGKIGADPAHIRTYAASRTDAEWNIIPLCRRHHIMQGQYGWRRMCEMYPIVDIALRERGWGFDERGKLARNV